jgi:AmmeMemoRadiSam system protein B
VILGTNHFGRGTGPVATGRDFQTPLGTTRTDRGFVSRLSERLGIDLCEHEFDHQQEHSVELQVLLLQHLLGPTAFQIVPVLCHDPCGPTGTGSYDGKGADLQAFARALGELVREEEASTSTIIIAGADLSHVGRRFGDDRDLDAAFLAHVERHDRIALSRLVDSADAEPFVATLRGHQNSTRVCSAGCIYALRTALPAAQVELLRYHQAVDTDSDTCVTCSAIALWTQEL